MVFYPGYKRFFSRVQHDSSVSVAGRNHERASREKKTSDTERCHLLFSLNFELLLRFMVRASSLRPETTREKSLATRIIVVVLIYSWADKILTIKVRAFK